MILEDRYFGSAITQRINTAINEVFNLKQAEKFIEWINGIEIRKFQNQPIQYIIKKDSDNQIVVFNITTRFNGIGRCDTHWVTLFDELGNVKNFEECEVGGDNFSDNWIQRELAKQLNLNSELIISFYKDGQGFVDNT
jgi:hypothetical protein